MAVHDSVRCHGRASMLHAQGQELLLKNRLSMFVSSQADFVDQKPAGK
jgi:hypothetical protein